MSSSQSETVFQSETVYRWNEFLDAWYPFPLNSQESKYEPSFSNSSLMVIRCIPIIGNIASAIQKHNDPKVEVLDEDDLLKNKIEYAKCERIGAFLLMLTGVALLILFPTVAHGNIAFAIAGGTTLGLGAIGALYFSREVKKLHAKLAEHQQG